MCTSSPSFIAIAVKVYGEILQQPGAASAAVDGSDKDGNNKLTDEGKRRNTQYIRTSNQL
jgi:hypothetical protein